ncbi:hypothetical protein DFQ27_000474 [Actinomortierella ambigua]|uniref:Fe2OG dioxygenase domain-containing protein n=1 Tax=Actinomortierella ambigua TaxID=1343610 RepID=A0A9P6QCN8_9FUNG|nr:hypothetical protein DFQ27_000474 [Actinomortierella ambigua]
MAAGIEQIPVIDFSLFHTDPEECARQVGVASQGIGFFYLMNHGVDQDMIDRMFTQSEKYFAQEFPEKLKYPIKTHNNGYSPFLSERCFNIRANATKSEYAHAFSMFDADTCEEVEKFFKDMYSVAQQVMQCFALSLKIPEQDGGMHFFDKSHVWEDESGTTLRFLRYPQQDRDSGIPSAGAHSDYGSCTLLLQRRIPGLEVQANRTHDNVPWVAAPVIPGSILVNIGDLLQKWTNGLLKSTKHRVVFHEMQRTSPRYSIACFIQPSNDARLDPIPSPVITQLTQPQVHENNVMTAKEYLDFKLNATYGDLEY